LVGVVFGLVHVSHPELAVLCAAAGVAWTALFLATPNLIPLALAHGWLGTLAYFWVLEMDPLRHVVLGSG
jgi:membrane protease YdiL (CAAX protease family)